MLREITAKEALDLYIMGEDVKALTPDEYADWGYIPTTLGSLLDGVRYLVDEEEKEAGDPEEPEEDTVEITMTEPITIPMTDPEKPAPQVNKRGKRLALDEGKIKALHKAGWSNVKIAEEMGVSDMTISQRIREMRERGEL